MLGVNTRLTIWNRYRDDDNKDAFSTFVIPYNCRYRIEKLRNISGQGDSFSSNIPHIQVVVIPFTKIYYKAPAEWRALDLLDKKRFFTFQINDLIALGEQYVDITGIEPFREVDVKKELQPHIFNIRIVSDNTRDVHGKHWRIEGS